MGEQFTPGKFADASEFTLCLLNNMMVEWLQFSARSPEHGLAGDRAVFQDFFSRACALVNHTTGEVFPVEQQPAATELAWDILPIHPTAPVTLAVVDKVLLCSLITPFALVRVPSFMAAPRPSQHWCGRAACARRRSAHIALPEGNATAAAVLRRTPSLGAIAVELFLHASPPAGSPNQRAAGPAGTSLESLLKRWKEGEPMDDDDSGDICPR